MGKPTQIQLGMVSSVAQFEDLVKELEERLGEELWKPSKLKTHIHVPSGPNERW